MSLSKPVLTGHSKKKYKEIRKYKRCGGKKKTPVGWLGTYCRHDLLHEIRYHESVL